MRLISVLIVVLSTSLVLIGCSAPINETPSGEIPTQTLPDPSIMTTPRPTREPTKVIEPDVNLDLIASPIDELVADDEVMPHGSYLGVEINAFGDEDVLNLVKESGVELMRINGIRWHQVEPEQGVRNWSVLRKIESALVFLSEHNIPVILVVRGAPLFAQKDYGYYCGSIKEAAFPAYTDFLSDLVQRYSQPPYNVKYWELGNEPDVAVGLTPVDAPYGCMGDESQPDYGGGDYAELLKQAYPVIRSVDPEAKVLIGGLLLDCDPTNPPEGKTCQPANYLEGILANGGGDYFDIVSYHGYPSYFNGKAVDETFESWDKRGGVILGKLDFIREVLRKYNLEKPIFHTESSLLCPSWNPGECNPPNQRFFDTQAQFVPRLYLRNWANGIEGTIWFTFDGSGWRDSGMVGSTGNPKPALIAYQYLVERFKGASYVGKITDNPQIVIYRFEYDGGQIWSVWSLDWGSHPYTLPEGVVEVTDIFGNPVDVENGQVNVDEVLYLTFENQ